MDYLDTYKRIDLSINNIAIAITSLLNEYINNSKLVMTKLATAIKADLNKYNYPIYPDDYDFSGAIPKVKYRDHYSTWLQVDKNTGDIYSNISSNLDVYNPFVIVSEGYFLSALRNGIGENYNQLTNAEMTVSYWLFNSMQHEDNMVESDIRNLSNRVWTDFSDLDVQLNQGLTNLKSYLKNNIGLNATQVDQHIHDVTDPITKAAADLYDYAHGLYDKTVAYLQPKIDAVSDYAKDIYTKVYNYFHPIIQDLSDYAHTIYQKSVDYLSPLIDKAEQGAKNFATSIGNNLQASINSISTYAHSIYDKAVNYLMPKITALSTYAHNIYGKVVNFLQPQIDKLSSYAHDIIDPDVTWLKTKLASLSDYAHTIYDKAINYLKPLIDTLSTYAHGIYNKAVNYLEPKILAVSQYAHTIYNKAVNYLSPIIQHVKDYATGLIARTKTELQSTIATLSSYAHTIYDKAVDFLQPKIDAVKVYTDKVYNEALAYTNSAIAKFKAKINPVINSIEIDLASIFKTFDRINKYLLVTLKAWEDEVAKNQQYFMSLIKDPAKLLSVLFNINVAKWTEIKPMLQIIAVHTLEL